MREHAFHKQVLSFLSAHAGGVGVSIIFCFGLSGISGSIIGRVITQIAVFFAYAFPIYKAAWSTGGRDVNLANYNHIKLDKWRGFKVGLCANIPWIITGILMILSKYGLFYNFMIPYKIINAEVWQLVSIIAPSIFLPDLSYLQVYAVAACTLIPVLMMGVFYIMGIHRFAIFERIIYKNKDNKNK